MHDPSVLLLDEPASGLDPRSRVDLRILLRRLADEGRTVLVSSHVLSELDEMADDAVFLSKGRTVVPVADASPTRTWHVRALSLEALTTWLTSTGAAWRPDDAAGLARPAPAACCSRSTARRAPRAWSATPSPRACRSCPSVPAGGALEQAYLTLEEERR